MRLINTARAASCLAVAALGFALSAQALAAPGDDVVVITHSAWRFGSNATDEIIRLTRHVSYADLDLTTSAGAKQLKVRIHEAANAMCDELERRSVSFPELAERLACVSGAVANGMQHARAAIAAAEKRTHTAGVARSG